ncbi:Hpt domain-containing protein [Sphingomonas sp. IC-56]|uniref:Hpt domain-containing protein n=1 Tax=Sphingomonas sp. IC-56 TaxID=2898529 RepID=UPI001E54D92E|nr:Hpt domain-containing protein [Sphingomonas sp. IC-56]
MTEFVQRMEALRRRFIDQVEEEAAQIERHAVAGEWSDVRNLSHRLAGRAGMFGFSGLTDFARTLEEAVDAGAPSEQLRQLAAELVRRLRTVED